MAVVGLASDTSQTHNVIASGDLLSYTGSDASVPCPGILYDPYTADGYGPLPGEPAPATSGYVRTTPYLGATYVREGKLYIYGSRVLDDDSVYAGFFQLDPATGSLTKLLSNRDPMPGFASSPCPGTHPDPSSFWPAFGNPALSRFGSTLGQSYSYPAIAFEVIQSVPNCTSGGSVTTGEILAYRFDTQSVSYVSPLYGAGSNPNNGYTHPSMFFNNVSSDGHLLIAMLDHLESDGSYTPSLYSVYLGQIATSLGLSGPATVAAAAPVVLTAQITPDTTSSNTPTRSVHFSMDSTALGDATPDASGKATYTVSSLSPGTHTLTAVYIGDDNFMGADSNTLTLASSQAAVTLVPTVSSQSVPVGSAFQVSVAVTPAGTPSIAPSGTVSLLNGTTVVASATLSNGSAILSYTSTTPGTVNLSLSYSGDANYLAATSTTIPVTFGVPDFTLTASPASATIHAGGTATFTIASSASFGYNQALSLSCSNLPANAKCVFLPATLTPGGSTTLTVQTNVAASMLTGTSQGRGTLGAVLAATLLALPFAWTRRRRLPAALFVLLLFGAFITLSGCGGGSSSPSSPSTTGNTPTGSTATTPAGTSTASVTAGAGGGTSHNIAINLTIQ